MPRKPITEPRDAAHARRLEAVRNWRSLNKDRAIKASQRWREENPLKAALSIKKSRRKNKDRVNAENRRWRERNPEKWKESTRKGNKKWAELNRERIKVASKEYYENNKQSIAAKAREKYLKNPDDFKERQKRYRSSLSDESIEKIRNRHREYSKRHPEMKRNAEARRRQILANGRKDVPENLKPKARHIKEILLRANGTCLYCKKKTKRLTIDHIQPISRGGLHSIDNLVASCGSCNSKKGNTPPEIFAAKIGLLII